MALPNNGQSDLAKKFSSSSHSLVLPDQVFSSNEPILSASGKLNGSDLSSLYTPVAPNAFGRTSNSLQTNHQSSVTYMAVIRRRECQAIRKLVIDFGSELDRTDLVMLALPITLAICTSLERIASGEREGNSREILRRLRDSFLDGGWNSYRGDQPVLSAIKALDMLSTAEHVTAKDVKLCTDSFESSGLRVLNLTLLADEDEDYSVHGEEN